MRFSRTLAVLTIAAALPAALAGTARGALSLTPSSEEIGIRLIAEDPTETVNNVAIRQLGDRYFVSDTSGVGSFPADCEREATSTVSCPVAAYYQVAIRTGPGPDVVNTLGPFASDPDAPHPFPVALGSGRDTYFGGDGINFARGGSGGDELTGYSRPDLLDGEGGRDVIRGAGGGDALFGGDGPDRVFGQSGRDFAHGGSGNDTVDLGDGRKELAIGGRGRDRCRGKFGDRVGGCEKIGPFKVR